MISDCVVASRILADTRLLAFSGFARNAKSVFECLYRSQSTRIGDVRVVDSQGGQHVLVPHLLQAVYSMSVVKRMLLTQKLCLNP